MTEVFTEDKRPRQRLRNPVPREGDNGLFSQSWFPICASHEIANGALVGREFLGGRVIAYRGENGVARVKSAYCPHLGADLSIGKVVGNNVRCAFHHWELGVDGHCVRTGIGDPPPPAARLFNFPTREKYGVVFAFNGEESLFELADLDVPSERTVSRVALMPMACDGWTFCANVPDFQHFLMVHRTDRDDLGKYDRIRWSEHGLGFEFTAFPDLGKAPPIRFKVDVQGTSLILVQGHLPDGRWYGTFAAMSLPRPGRTDVFVVCSIEKIGDDAESAHLEQEILASLMAAFMAMAMEDHTLLETAHYCPGALTKHDTALARYMEMLRSYPRAHPAASFIA